MQTEGLTSGTQLRSFKQLVSPSMIVRFASLDILPSFIDESMTIAADLFPENSTSEI
jgi:hypothetical protein